MIEQIDAIILDSKDYKRKRCTVKCFVFKIWNPASGGKGNSKINSKMQVLVCLLHMQS